MNLSGSFVGLRGLFMLKGFFPNQRFSVVLGKVAFDDIRDNACGTAFRDESDGNAKERDGGEETVHKATSREISAVSVVKVSARFFVEADVIFTDDFGAKVVRINDCFS